MFRVHVRHFTMLLLISASLLAYGSMLAIFRSYGTPVHGNQMVQTIAWFLLAFAAYVAGLVWMQQRGGLPLKWIWWSAVIFRLIMLLSGPALSDDVYRYLWDGHLANNGVSPYAFAIEDSSLDYLSIPPRESANHTWMASPYLPAAQFLFRGLTKMLPLQPVIMQAAMAVSDLLAAYVLMRLLQLVSLPRHWVFIYLWNPLVIVETANNAHIDAWMLLLLLVGIYLSLQPAGMGIRILGPLFLALATLTKPLPLLLLPVLYWRWNWRQRATYAAVVAGMLIPAGVRAGWGLTGPLDGTGVFGALRIYAAQWNFNSGLFHWLERLLGSPGYGTPTPTAKLVVLGVLLLILLLVFGKARQLESRLGTLRLLSLPLMAYMLLSPTAHPWYLLSLLALLPFLVPQLYETGWQWSALIPWLYLGGAIFFSYLTYVDHRNPAELEWVRLLEWLPTLLLLSAYVCWRLGQFRDPSINGANTVSRQVPD